MLKTLTYAAVLAAFTTSAFAADAPVVTGKLGEDTYLMAADTHMTLYTFDKDEKGVSNCNDACAGLWPPVIGEAGTALPNGYSLISRKDGTEQAAYKGQPLYLWVKDKNPCDMTGERYHLKGWLSNRLGSEVRIPDLTAKGLTMLHWLGGTWHSALVGPYGKDRMTEIAQSIQGAMY